MATVSWFELVLGRSTEDAASDDSSFFFCELVDAFQRKFQIFLQINFQDELLEI